MRIIWPFPQRAFNAKLARPLGPLRSRFDKFLDAPDLGFLDIPGDGSKATGIFVENPSL